MVYRTFQRSTEKTDCWRILYSDIPPMKGAGVMKVALAALQNV